MAVNVGLLAFAHARRRRPATSTYASAFEWQRGRQRRDHRLGRRHAVYVTAVDVSGFALATATAAPGREDRDVRRGLDALVAPTAIPGGDDMELPSFAYSPAQNEFGIVWNQKNVTNDDDV